MRPGRNAHRPGRAHIGVRVLNVPLLSNTCRRRFPRSPTYTLPCASVAIECGVLNCPGSVPSRSPGLEEFAVLVEFRDPRVAVAVGDENVPRRIPGHVGRPIEIIARCPAPGTPRPPAPAARRRLGRRNIDRLRLPAQRHQDSPLRVELDDHARPFIDHPDVVLRIDPHHVREQEPVQPLSDLAHERPVGANSNSRAPPCVKVRDPPMSSPWCCRSACRRKCCPSNSSPRRPLRPCGCAPASSAGWAPNRKRSQEPTLGQSEPVPAGNRGKSVNESLMAVSDCLQPYFVFGCSVSFCTRHAVISDTSSSFSFRQSISWTVLNSPSALPAFPNLPTIVPSSSIL